MKVTIFDQEGNDVCEYDSFSTDIFSAIQTTFRIYKDALKPGDYLVTVNVVENIGMNFNIQVT